MKTKLILLIMCTFPFLIPTQDFFPSIPEKIRIENELLHIYGNLEIPGGRIITYTLKGKNEYESRITLGLMVSSIRPQDAHQQSLYELKFTAKRIYLITEDSGKKACKIYQDTQGKPVVAYHLCKEIQGKTWALDYVTELKREPSQNEIEKFTSRRKKIYSLLDAILKGDPNMAITDGNAARIDLIIKMKFLLTPLVIFLLGLLPWILKYKSQLKTEAQKYFYLFMPIIIMGIMLIQEKYLFDVTRPTSLANRSLFSISLVASNLIAHVFSFYFLHKLIRVKSIILKITGWLMFVLLSFNFAIKIVLPFIFLSIL